MRKGMWLATLVVAGILGQTSAVVLDDMPADFRGEEGTTFQSWDFLTNADPASPEVMDNNYGGAVADPVGDFTTNIVWLADDYGHQGVWGIDRFSQNDMLITIYNSKVANPYKEIWVQIVYSAHSSDDPFATPSLYVQPDGKDFVALDLVQGSEKKIDEAYNYAVYHGIIRPNPQVEVIRIRPRDCMVYVDSIIVETQCIPEPVSMVLLGLGGLILRKRMA